MQVRIRNPQTGETRIVDSSQVAQYGLDPNNIPKANIIQTPPSQAPVTQQPGQQSDFATGIGNSILGILGNIISPLTTGAQTIGEGINQGAQGIDFLLGNKRASNNNIIPQSLRLSPSEIQKIVQNPTGEAVKQAAGVGAFAIPFGRAAEGAGLLARLLTKSVLPGAGVGALQSINQGNTTPGGIVGNAALGATGAGALHGLLGVPGLIGKTGGALESAGNAITRTQYSVPAKTAENLNLGQTIQKLGEYGFRNINDIAKVAPLITGDTGIITQLTRDAVSQSSPVNTGGILNFAKNLLDNEPLINAATAKKFSNMVSKSIPATAGNAIAGGDPIKVFDFVQQLESKASQLGRGGDESRALGSVYKGVARELKDRLFTGETKNIPSQYKYALNQQTGRLNKINIGSSPVTTGADSALVGSVLTPEALQKIAAISPQLAKEVSQVQTVGELRSLAAPFVRGSQLAEKTFSKQNNEIINKKDIGAGVIGALLSGGNPLLTGAGVGVEKLLTSNTGKTALGNVLSDVGKGVANAGQNAQVTNPLLQNLLGQGASRVPTSLVNQTGNGVNSNNNEKQNYTQNIQNSLPPDQSLPQNLSGVNRQQYPITPEMVSKAYQVLPERVAARIEKAYNAQFLAVGGNKPLSANQQASKANAEGGLRDLANVQNIIANDPGVVLRKTLPLGIGARDYKAAEVDMLNNYIYLKTGKQASDAERKSFDALLPQPGESQSTINAKLQIFKDFFNQIAYQQVGVGGNIDTNATTVSP